MIPLPSPSYWRMIHKQFTLDQLRAIAIQTMGACVRFIHIDYSLYNALETLNEVRDIARRDPYLLVSQWYLHATSRQIKLFVREWEEMTRGHNEKEK